MSMNVSLPAFAQCSAVPRLTAIVSRSSAEPDRLSLASIQELNSSARGGIFHIGNRLWLGQAERAADHLAVLLALVWPLQSRAGARRCGHRAGRDLHGDGIDVDGHSLLRHGGALAGSRSSISYFTQARFDLGFRLGLFAFTAAVLGGIGNMAGAALGGYMIGFIENFNNGLDLHTPGPDWPESIVFILLILILVFRPQGLLGEALSTRA